jgi:sulfate transport system permease protein
MASYRLTFGTSLIAALVNLVFGLLRCTGAGAFYSFRQKLVDALVDLPFALPTAVAAS